MYHVLDYTYARWLISWLSLVEGQSWLDYWKSWLPQSLVDLKQKLNWVKVSYGVTTANDLCEIMLCWGPAGMSYPGMFMRVPSGLPCPMV
jgi:hypothetical protein